MIRIVKWKADTICDNCGEGHLNMISILFDIPDGQRRINLCFDCLQKLYKTIFDYYVECGVEGGNMNE